MEFTKNVIHRTMYKFNDTPNGQICSDVGRSIAEQYINGRINIHVHVGFETEEYCAVFNGDVEKPHLWDSISCKRDSHILSEGSPGEQKVSMLIRVTELMEIPEVLGEENISRRITWLKRINERDMCVWNPLELTPFLTIVFENVVEDGKFIPVCGDVTGRRNQFPNDVVKGTPEIIQHFTDTQTQVFGNGGNAIKAIDLVSRCVLDIFGDTIGFEVTEGEQITAKSLTLFFGPGKFS